MLRKFFLPQPHHIPSYNIYYARFIRTSTKVGASSGTAQRNNAAKPQKQQAHKTLHAKNSQTHRSESFHKEKSKQPSSYQRRSIAVVDAQKSQKSHQQRQQKFVEREAPAPAKSHATVVPSSSKTIRLNYTELHVINILFGYYRSIAALRSATAAAASADKSSQKHQQQMPPLDAYVSLYLKRYNMGTNQRKLVTSIVFDLMRWMLLVQYLAERLFVASKSFGSLKSGLLEGIETGVSEYLKREKTILDETGQVSSHISTSRNPDLLKKKLRTEQGGKFDLMNHLETGNVWKTFADKSVQDELLMWRIRYFVFSELVLKNQSVLATLLPRDLAASERYLDAILRENLDKLGPQNPVVSEELAAAALKALEDAPPNVRVSVPSELFDTVLRSFQGDVDKTTEFCQISNRQAPIFLRLNALKVQNRKAFLAMFKESWAKAHEGEQKKQGQQHQPIPEITPTSKSPLGLKISKRINFAELDLFKKGYFEVQDEASQVVADYVNPRPGDLVLDYCAGGGGKTLAFAHKMKGKGQIVMTDTRYAPRSNGEGSKLVTETKERLRRAGIQNAQQLVPNHPHLSENMKGKFNWVLLDVPCSGTGTMRRHPELKYKFELPWLRELVGIQRQIIDSAIPFLQLEGKDRGYLVYSTCSVLQEENTSQVNYILGKYGHLLELETTWSSLPEEGECDGFFVAVFRAKSKAISDKQD